MQKFNIKFRHAFQRKKGKIIFKRKLIINIFSSSLRTKTGEHKDQWDEWVGEFAQQDPTKGILAGFEITQSFLDRQEFKALRTRCRPNPSKGHWFE
jgi:hypothetical protein